MLSFTIGKGKTGGVEQQKIDSSWPPEARSGVITDKFSSWQLGVLLYELISGEKRPDSSGNFDVAASLKNGSIPAKIIESLSSLLAVNPNNRASVQQFLTAITSSSSGENSLSLPQSKVISVVERYNLEFLKERLSLVDHESRLVKKGIELFYFEITNLRPAEDTFTTHEIQTIFRKHFLLLRSVDVLNEIFATLDKEQTGLVSIYDFIQAFKEKEKTRQKEEIARLMEPLESSLLKGVLPKQKLIDLFKLIGRNDVTTFLEGRSLVIIPFWNSDMINVEQFLVHIFNLIW
eukprot:TRINITY_DN4007_c0_g1_i1.p1 TRINITY_DN4007_c0_g1~~TRINITY_DN4007_c0_g1_i1.p1  ORF type:complete len:291 (+),score=42.75 TRINITY_DN4007_c0_g1_i1:797-1669(+)